MTGSRSLRGIGRAIAGDHLRFRHRRAFVNRRSADRWIFHQVVVAFRFCLHWTMVVDTSLSLPVDCLPVATCFASFLRYWPLPKLGRS